MGEGYIGYDTLREIEKNVDVGKRMRYPSKRVLRSKTVCR